MADSDAENSNFDLFNEPEDFYEAEKKPTFVSHRMLNGTELTLRLVGHNPLWGHFLWNAGKTVADFIETNFADIAAGKSVLELGAGAGLPSLVCVRCGANRVVVTDYPDPDLIENLRINIQQCTNISSVVSAEGYLWGADNKTLVAHLPQGDGAKGFDLLILADLLFNHSEHTKLLQSIQHNLKRSPDASALVFFTPYRPWLLGKDLAFFDLARGGGFKVRKILEKVMDKVMFDDDPGDELLRRTVYGYCLQWESCRA